MEFTKDTEDYPSGSFVHWSNYSAVLFAPQLPTRTVRYVGKQAKHIFENIDYYKAQASYRRGNNWVERYTRYTSCKYFSYDSVPEENRYLCFSERPYVDPEKRYWVGAAW